MQITIRNRKYNIAEFINDHPGGKDVFVSDTDLTEAFDAVGHSTRALKLLETFAVEPAQTAVVGTSKLRKLVTREDPYHVHKVLGFIALLNYGYMMVDLIYGGCRGVFVLRKIDSSFFILLFLHACLSLSSLQFKVPIQTSYSTITINAQYRGHSILFVFRHISLILVLCFTRGIVTDLATTFIGLFSMYSADFVSRKLGTPKKGLISSWSFWDSCNLRIRDCLLSLYSYSQLTVTYILITGKSSVELNMYALFVLQITAFMLTLSKKGILSTYQFHSIYASWFILLPILYSRCAYVRGVDLIFGFITWILRTKLNVNKFFLWTTVSILYLTTKHTKSILWIVVATGINCSVFYSFKYCYDAPRKIGLYHSIIAEKQVVAGNKIKVIIKIKGEPMYFSGQYFNLYVDTAYFSAKPEESTDVGTVFLVQSNGTIGKKLRDMPVGSYIHVTGPFL